MTNGHTRQGDGAASEQPRTDLRMIDTHRLQGYNFTARDYIILGLAHTNSRDPIESLSRLHMFVYIAQQGGLSTDSGRPLPGCDPVPEYFDFERGPQGPYSEDLTERVNTLVDSGLLDEHEYTTPSGGTGRSYEFTDLAEEVIADDVTMTPEKYRTLKAVKTVYERVPIFEVLDKCRHDFR